MAAYWSLKRRKAFIKYFLGFFLLIFIFLLIFVNRFVEPILRDRLHTLIIQGSDSLYLYHLGDLDANFFGGNVEVENLQIRIDSNHYRQLEQQNALPSLTMQLDLQKGHIKGLGVFSLIFGKQIKITEILSQEANIKLSRHLHKENNPQKTLPLWKAIQPNIKDITIDKINLDGIKLLYKNTDTTNSLKLQFDRCVAMLKDIKIDSASEADTSRIGFIKSVSMQFYDLKFRTPDSSYKMKAKEISYSSEDKLLEIKDFKLQPTLEKEDFIHAATYQQSMYVVMFDKIRFTNLLIDRYILNNIITADSVLIDKPDITIYNDKTLPPDMSSKIGKYPHQHLLKANATIMIKGARVSDARLSYTERSEKTRQEGFLGFTNLNAIVSNATNDPYLIKQNPKCIVAAQANIFDSSPIQATFTFHLDDTEGGFDAQGMGGNLNAAQLNSVAEPLARVQIRSLNVSSIHFQVHGDDYSAKGNVQMRYNNLAIALKKEDKETGEIKTKKFFTNIINKYALYPGNPGSDGHERTARNVVYARVSSKSFFGVIWKTVFAGMQNIMMKAGRYE
jgi:hypothetical protein